MSKADLTRDWLYSEGACGPDVRRTLDQLIPAEGVAPTWEFLDACRRVGVHIQWGVCHIAGDTERAAFLVHTLALRKTFTLRTLTRAIGAEAEPATAAAATQLADEFDPRWTEGRDRTARNVVRVLRDYARDLVTEPTAGAAMEAFYATRRAYDYAGLDGNAVGVELEDWLAEKIVGTPRSP